MCLCSSYVLYTITELKAKLKTHPFYKNNLRKSRKLNLFLLCENLRKEKLLFPPRKLVSERQYPLLYHALLIYLARYNFIRNIDVPIDCISVLLRTADCPQLIAT